MSEMVIIDELRVTALQGYGILIPADYKVTMVEKFGLELEEVQVDHYP